MNFRTLLAAILTLFAALLDMSAKNADIEDVSGRTWICVEESGSLRLAYSDKGRFTGSHTVGPEKLSCVHSGILWLSPDGQLYLYYTETDGYYDGRGILKCIRCEEPASDRPVWGGPEEIGVGVCTGKPVVSSSGSWVMPVALWGRTLIGSTPDFYGNDRQRTDDGAFSALDSLRGPLVNISEDKGGSWKMHRTGIAVPEMVPARYNNPRIVGDGQGNLKMILRSSGTGWSYSSMSSDCGMTWSAPEKFIQNPDREAAFSRLPDGRLLMVKVGKYDKICFLRGDGLYAYLSDDLGCTWYGGLCISKSPEADSPAVACKQDGKIEILYHEEGKVLLAGIDAGEIVRGMTEPEYIASDIRTLYGKSADKSKVQDRAKSSKKKPTSDDGHLRVCTYNIQYRNDALCKWSNRLDALKGFFDEYQPDIVGAQEPYGQEVDDIVVALDGKYGWIGINNKNESAPPYSRYAAFNPVFYRKDRVKVEEWDIVWYTPKAAERGYGAEYPRFMIWARMSDLRSGKEFYIFNSHFDHKGVEARRVAAEILVRTVREIAGDSPAILTGDFNSTETSIPYSVILDSGFLGNAKLAVENPVNHLYYSQARYKSINTVSQKDIHIDHVFYTPANSDISYWELVIKTFGGYYGSDHLPIVVDWHF